MDTNLERVASGGSGTVKAHRTKHEKKICRNLKKFVADGNEKADELAKTGAMLDEGFMAEVRAETMQQEREEVYAAFQYTAGFHCLVKEWKYCEELKPTPKEMWTTHRHSRRAREQIIQRL